MSTTSLNTPKDNAPDALQAMQAQWAGYLRDPRNVSQPEPTAERPMRVYEELVSNNVMGFLDQCFPVTQSIVGKKAWRDYGEQFLAHWSCDSPYFRDIPQSFVAYMQAHIQELDAPEWMPELLHYEWVELAVETAADEDAVFSADGLGVNPTARLLVYAWPVHTISADQLPEQPQPTFLLVYRDAEHSVRFVQLQAMSARLLELLVEHDAALDKVIQTLAQDIGTEVDVLADQAQPQLLQWIKDGVLWQKK